MKTKIIPAIIFAVAANCFVLAQETPLPFTLKDTNGNSVNIENDLGKNVVFISFWATWCTSCIQELDAVNKIYQKYEDKGLKVYAINVDDAESPGYIKGFAESKQYRFTVLLDNSGELLSRYQPSMATPFAILVDKSGYIVEKKEGFSADDAEKLESEIATLLEKNVTGVKVASETPVTSAITSTQTEKLSSEPQFKGELYFAPQYRKLMVNNPGADAPDPPYIFNLKSYLSLDARFGGWSASGLVTDNQFFDAKHESNTQENFITHQTFEVPVTIPEDRFELEKISVAYENKDGTVKAIGGDFHTIVANGLGISLRRLDLEGEDNTLRGAKGDFILPTDTKITGMGGKVNALPFVGTEDRFRETVDGTAGGFVLEQPIPANIATLGAFGFISKFAFPGDPILEESDYQWYGGYLNLLPQNRYFNLTTAGAFRRLNNRKLLENNGEITYAAQNSTEVEEDGHGIFSEFNLFLGNWTFIGAVKSYDHFYVRDPGNPEIDSVQLINPPTLEPENQEIKQNRDVWGAKGGARYAFSPKLSGALFLNKMYYTEFEDENEVSYQGWTDWIYQGDMLRFIRFDGGYRRETENNVQTGKLYVSHSIIHGILDTTIAISPKHELKPNVSARFHTQDPSGHEEREFEEIQTDLGYQYTSQYGLAFLYGYSNRVESKGPNFYAGSLIWRPTNDLALKLLAGTMYGGIRCVAGICREMPDFEGVKLEFTSRF